MEGNHAMHALLLRRPLSAALPPTREAEPLLITQMKAEKELGLYLLVMSF